MKTSYYIIITNIEKPELEWGKAMQETMGVCSNCVKAYEIANFLAGITNPDTAYRKVLETIKIKGACTIKQKGGEQAATIILSKKY